MCCSEGTSGQHVLAVYGLVCLVSFLGGKICLISEVGRNAGALGYVLKDMVKASE